MRTTRLVAASALSALLLLPTAAVARSPKGVESVAPAAGFTATVTTKAYFKSLTISVTPKATGVPSGQNVTGYFLSEDPIANPTGKTPGWKVSPTSFAMSDGDGSRTIYVWAKTKSQVSARGSATTFIDRVAPVVSAFDVVPATSTSRTVAVTMTGADDQGVANSGIAKYAVVNGTAAPGASSSAWVNSAPTSIKLPGGNGEKTVSAFVKDKAGNVSAVRSDTVTLTMPAPSVDLVLPQYTKSQSVSVSLTPTDGAGAGIAGYILKESASPAPTASSTAWLTKPTSFKLSSGQGSKTVYAWVKDKAGNVSASDSATTLWDATAPTASLTITTTSPTSNPKINVTASGNAGGGSPIAKYALVSGTTPPSLAGAWKDTAPTTFDLPSGLGTKTVSLFVKDAAGNVSAPSTKTITFSVPPPTVTLDIKPLASNKLTVPIAVDTTDPSGKGIKGYFLSTTNTAPTASTAGWKLVTTTFTFPAGDGNKTLYAWVKDGNGTVSAASSDTVRIDQTLPVATTTVANNNSASVAVTVAGSDANSGTITGYAMTLVNVQPDATDDLAWYSTSADAWAALSASVTGTVTVYGWVKDSAKNVSVTVANTSSKSVTKP
jgi:hypothetical protein